MPTPPSEYRYPCENCGASLEFSPGQQSLVCPYCGHEQHIGPGPARAPARQPQQGPWGESAILLDPATGRALQWDGGHKSPGLRELPLEHGLSLDQHSDLTEAVRTLSCPNCGAKVEITSDRHASACPFCATAVVTDTGTTRHIKPQGVLPFVITEAQAKAALEDWLHGLWFAPSGLTAYARRGKRMSGVYSPFWTFDADTASRYTGARGDWYYETVYVTQMVNGRQQRVAQQVRKTRWTPVSGQVARDFDDVLVLASSSLPRRITDALTPWELSHLVPYQPEYLAGFLAEGYTIPLASGHGIARQEMAGVIAMDVRRAIGGNEQRITGIETRYSDETFKHVLLPVWTAAYRYNGKSYRFVVNGQSGRVQGERPWSVWKIAFAVLLALALLLALLWLNERGDFVRIGAAPLTPDISMSGSYRYQETGAGGPAVRSG
ncbi:TFIIB-type zinc ribbon-containing protein [Paracoccus denitrificans]|uniref:zinc ribbon domain-containing protein n=1 Tax=Paracoccus denitrificans TaxID=266 RepID=UPI000CEC8915|nr:zinc ribbon domain-containing protein [Paracoccus denitrificans]